MIAGLMSIWAAFADQHGGIWGASRHALSVGFAATMVFSIGPRILPHFGGVHGIFSKRLMFLSLLFLQTGCLLRVSSEPLAYEGLLPFAWKVLPISGMLELSGVLLFATNLSLTFLLGLSLIHISVAVTGILAYIFFGLILFARATNHWQTNIPRAVYMKLVPHANEVTHPGM